MAAYTIQSGDTLANIAAKNNTSVDVLAKTNNIIDPNKINAGATINLPDSTPPAATSATLPLSQQVTKTTVDSSVFKPPTGSTLVTTPPSGPISTADLTKATTLPEPSTFSANVNNTPSLSDNVSKVAGTSLTANQQVIDTLQKQREDLVAQEKDAAAATEKGLTTSIDSFTKTTAAQDALDAVNKKFDIENKIQQYTDIQTKIVAAQEALQMGLIYEGDRPARLELLTGRSASLQKQGLATIGALQGTAEVLKGNIDLARSYAETTINAINDDNKTSLDSLKTLLSLADQKLVDLSTEEKTLLDSRIKAITDQNDKIQKDKEDILGFMTDYPDAFLKGGVTLLDTKETALQKMLPTLSAKETQKFNADIAAKLKAASTATDKDGPAADKQQLLALKANGMTYPEAVNAYANTLSIDWINAVYRESSADKAVSPQDQITNAYYAKYLNADGTPKPGVSISIDPKNGRPLVSQSSSEPGFFGKLFQGWIGH